MKKQILILIFFALLGNLINAQTGELSGKVIDKEYNDVLPFANVIIKGSSIGTTTDFEGNYSFKLDEGVYTVVFSFIGYETIEISANSVKEFKANTIINQVKPWSAETPNLYTLKISLDNNQFITKYIGLY